MTRELFKTPELAPDRTTVVTPTVLVATTSCWYPTARLAMALSSAGCRVDAVCPASHPVRKTRCLRQAYGYAGLAPLTSFARAIASSQPDFVISGDDLATEHLHHLYAREQQKGEAGAKMAAVIARSFGNPQSFPVMAARTAFIDLAREEGVRVPATQVIASVDELEDWIGKMGFPTVLKANGTSGGDGVRIVRTLAEAQRAFAQLQAPPLLARAVKRALVDHDKTLLWPSILRHRPVVNAQSFVEGREATSAVVCWRGSVLASLHFEVVNKASTAGHATVLRMMENAEMAMAAERMVRRLGLSGFFGFDFMLERGAGNAYLIEINPRSTQVGHLSLGPEKDLPAALYAALSGDAVRPRPRVTERDTIALFPQEWIRDPQSSYLQTAYHDVPWEEPELVHDCVGNRRKQSSWYKRAARTSSATRRSERSASVAANQPLKPKAPVRKSVSTAVLESNRPAEQSHSL
jgi:hypothetical protein